MKLQNNADSALIISKYPFPIQVNACSVFPLRHDRTLFIKFIHSLFDTRTIWKLSSENATLFTVLESRVVTLGQLSLSPARLRVSRGLG